MAVIRGCQEGKGTPKLAEVKCPKCGAELEVVIHMGGKIGETVCTVYEETFDCCYVIVSGTA